MWSPWHRSKTWQGLANDLPHTVFTFVPVLYLFNVHLYRYDITEFFFFSNQQFYTPEAMQMKKKINRKNVDKMECFTTNFARREWKKQHCWFCVRFTSRIVLAVSVMGVVFGTFLLVFQTQVSNCCQRNRPRWSFCSETTRNKPTKKINVSLLKAGPSTGRSVLTTQYVSSHLGNVYFLTHSDS